MRDQDQRDQRDRDVDPEDRPPGPLDQVAARDRADRGQPAGDAEEQRQRPAAGAQVEGLHDDRDRGREHERAAQALDRAERDQPRLGPAAARGGAAQRRRGREDDHPDHDHPPVPDDVAQPAAEREQGRQRQQVGVDRPLDAAGRQAQVVLDRRRGDGDDRLVDERHRHGEDHRGQDQAPAACPAAAAAAAAGAHGGPPVDRPCSATCRRQVLHLLLGKAQPDALVEPGDLVERDRDLLAAPQVPLGRAARG